MPDTTHDQLEDLLAEIFTEATGEPRAGRLEHTLAKSALARLREAGMTMSTPPIDEFCGQCAGPFTGHLEQYGGHWDTCPNRVSSPPAGDVRETLARIIDAVDDGTQPGQSERWENIYPQERDQIVTAILADPSIEVRPRGTVTDAGREDAWEEWSKDHAFEHDTLMRVQLFAFRAGFDAGEAATALKGQDGCSCEPFDQDAGGGRTERLLEYQPNCPVHSTHLYDPRQGEWVIDPREMVNDV